MLETALTNENSQYDLIGKIYLIAETLTVKVQSFAKLVLLSSLSFALPLLILMSDSFSPASIALISIISALPTLLIAFIAYRLSCLVDIKDQFLDVKECAQNVARKSPKIKDELKGKSLYRIVKELSGLVIDLLAIREFAKGAELLASVASITTIVNPFFFALCVFTVFLTFAWFLISVLSWLLVMFSVLF